MTERDEILHRISPVLKQWRHLSPKHDIKEENMEMELCPHGTLKRKCELCERDDIIADLKKHVVELEQENDTLIDHNIRLIGDNTALKKRVEELDNLRNILVPSADKLLARAERAETSFANLMKAVRLHEQRTKLDFISRVHITRYDKELWENEGEPTDPSAPE